MAVSQVTAYGLQRITEAAQNGPKITVSALVVGDGAPTATGAGGTIRYSISNPAVTIDALDPTVITVKGTIPANVGGWNINSFAVLDNTGAAIAVAEGSGDPKRGQDDPFPQAYDITFLIKVSNAEAFDIVFAVGGDYLPLAGGNMNYGAAVKFSEPATGPSATGATVIKDNEITLSRQGDYTTINKSGISAVAVPNNSNSARNESGTLSPNELLLKTYWLTPATFENNQVEMRLVIVVRHPGGGAPENIRTPFLILQQRTRNEDSGSAVWSEWTAWAEVKNLMA